MKVKNLMLLIIGLLEFVLGVHHHCTSLCASDVLPQFFNLFNDCVINVSQVVGMGLQLACIEKLFPCG